MKVNELMIGDWLHSKLHNVDSTVIEIEGKAGLYSDPAVWLDDKICWERHFMHEIEPIPLTEELLQKYFPTDKELAWWPTTTVNGVPEFFHFEYARTDWEIAIELSSVHELQHLLLMCGIDKEIVLK